MLFARSLILACLTVTATAIDIHWYRNRGCSGSYGRCTNMPASGCCTLIPQDVNSAVSWNNIPTDQNIIAQGYWQEGCSGNIAGSGRSNYLSSLCFPTPQYRGAKYHTINGLRHTNTEENPAETEAPCRKPDVLVFEDGHEFNLTDLNEEQYSEVVCISFCAFESYKNFMSGGSSSEVETFFAALDI
ncbi:uncharacterized protein B0I36DRAFT_366390 [Microdochium trichocladiopsis]|uniref:Uncharacterized protein n=1 Tax=Microdochium trichocladiopsis TaxID=1682393 RepID=A0A9P9BL20_9PEZI|nr:uncharacterized protein B0I36DRAFT_366390 [Microdochium trichocladiopsis]KAH7024444.1 hypothetical protein B0I36DRAFT_366390 [Microdochium trichocladiopsis]